MTYKEKLKKEAPYKIDSLSVGGCIGCPGSMWEGAPKIKTGSCPKGGASEENCTKCWNSEAPNTEPTTEIDIHKIIDDAMEKKDREVMIFISKDHTNVSVIPVNSTKPRWIESEGNSIRCRYKCSECGAFTTTPSPFCPLCGEKMSMPEKEAKDGE